MLAKRFFSFVIDYLMVIPFCMVITIILLVKTQMCESIGLSIFTTVFLYMNPFLVINMPTEAMITMIICFVFPAITVYCVYCLLMELCFKKTIGHKKMKITYINENGKYLSNKQVIIRNILKYICFGLGFVGIISIPFSKNQRPLYDVILKIDITKTGKHSGIA